MVGGLGENPVSRKMLSATVPYHFDDLTWCVSTPKSAINWLNVYVELITIKFLFVQKIMNRFLASKSLTGFYGERLW